MDRQPAFLKPRVARRILALFVVTALVPVAALAGVSLVALDAQLLAQSQERLRQLARNAGQSILQQLLHVERSLATLVMVEGDEIRLRESAIAGLTAVSWLSVTEDGQDGVRTLMGGQVDLPVLSPDARSRVDEGGMAIVTRGSEAELVVAVQIDGATGPPATIWFSRSISARCFRSSTAIVRSLSPAFTRTVTKATPKVPTITSRRENTLSRMAGSIGILKV